jgi:hypothetical protein
MEAPAEIIGARELSAERIAYLAQSRIPEIIACNVVLLVFATGGLLVRLFVRVRYLTGINLDDMVCMASWVRLSLRCPPRSATHACSRSSPSFFALLQC